MQYLCTFLSLCVASYELFVVHSLISTWISGTDSQICGPCNKSLAWTSSTTGLQPEKGRFLRGIARPWRYVPKGDVGVSIKRVTVSKKGWVIRENLIKMDDLGLPPFQEPPISSSWTVCCGRSPILKHLILGWFTYWTCNIHQFSVVMLTCQRVDLCT